MKSKENNEIVKRYVTSRLKEDWVPDEQDGDIYTAFKNFLEALEFHDYQKNKLSPAWAGICKQIFDDIEKGSMPDIEQCRHDLSMLEHSSKRV